MKNIKDKFRALPEALQKHILVRGVLSIAALLLFVFILIYTKEFTFALPCIALSLFMIVNGGLLLYNCIRNKFVVVKGTCMGVEKTALRKRVKTLSMEVGDHVLTVSARQRLKVPSVGDEISIYLPENAPVYEKDGGYHIYNFYALEINRKV